MTYTEAQVQALIYANTRELAVEIADLKSKLAKESVRREEAEKKYLKLCEGCVTAYVNERDILTDSFLVQVTAPRFLSTTDFETGVIQRIVHSLSDKRERVMLMSDMTQTRKTKNETA